MIVDKSKGKGRSQDKSSGGGFKGRSKSRGKSTSRECYFCKKIDHYKKACYAYKKWLENKKGKGKE